MHGENVGIDGDRIRAVTANFFFWQGYRWVPLGLAMLVLALGSGPWWNIPEPLEIGLIAAVFASGLVASRRIGRYYRERWGHVCTRPGQHARRNDLKWRFVYPLMLVSLLFDILWGGPILTSGLVWGAAVLAYRHSTGGGRRHYLLAAATLMLSTVVPMLGLRTTEAVNLLFAIVGVTYAVGGVLDHRELRRLFPPDPSLA